MCSRGAPGAQRGLTLTHGHMNGRMSRLRGDQIQAHADPGYKADVCEAEHLKVCPLVTNLVLDLR